MAKKTDPLNCAVCDGTGSINGGPICKKCDGTGKAPEVVEQPAEPETATE